MPLKGANRDEFNPEYLSKNTSRYKQGSFPQSLRTLEDMRISIDVTKGAKDQQRTSLEVVYEHYRSKELRGKSRLDPSKKTNRFIAVPILNYSAGTSYQRVNDYVRTTHDMSSVMKSGGSTESQISGILTSIRSKKRHEGKLVQRYGGRNNSISGEAGPNDQIKTARTAKPQVDPKYDPIQFESLSLAEKIHLHQVTISKKTQMFDYDKGS